jgi:alkanesulfonate monooxygenase SsuD/methylene tetrahydromethanopterin reductase-like flavin-dependent oxidoreductase (luciferase family)
VRAAFLRTLIRGLTHATRALKAPRMATHPIRFGIQTGRQNIEGGPDARPVAEGRGLGIRLAEELLAARAALLEAWNTLAALAQAPKRARIGTMVTGNTYRHSPIVSLG